MVENHESPWDFATSTLLGPTTTLRPGCISIPYPLPYTSPIEMAMTEGPQSERSAGRNNTPRGILKGGVVARSAGRFWGYDREFG